MFNNFPKVKSGCRFLHDTVINEKKTPHIEFMYLQNKIKNM